MTDKPTPTDAELNTILRTQQPAPPPTAQATAAPAGDWLWVKLMDFCKK